MIFLTNTTHTLEVATSSTSTTNYYISYVDITTSWWTPWDNQGSISSATTTTVLSAPAASTQRQIKLISIENTGTDSNTYTIKKDVSATEYVIYTCTLKPWENLTYTDGKGFDKHAQDGSDISMTTNNATTPISTTSFNFMKVWSTAESAGVLHSLHDRTGTPWAWAPWTPWLNGRATDWTTASDKWCIPVKNPATWVNYLTSHIASATTASAQMLIDILWVNSGLVVTTTTAQAITFTTLPARDATGTTNWEDVMIWLLVTTATTNAGAITNCTASYTDSDWNAGNTATMSSFPITAVAGTIVPFQLAAWDKWVRSVQSVTLGTSMVTGAVSLIAYRIISWVPVLVANAGWKFQPALSGVNVRLYNGVCLIPVYMPTATTATTVTWFINIEEK